MVNEHNPKTIGNEISSFSCKDGLVQDIYQLTEFGLTYINDSSGNLGIENEGNKITQYLSQLTDDELSTSYNITTSDISLNATQLENLDNSDLKDKIGQFENNIFWDNDFLWRGDSLIYTAEVKANNGSYETIYPDYGMGGNFQKLRFVRGILSADLTFGHGMFTSGNTYTVKFTATDLAGNSATIEKELTVYYRPTVADIPDVALTEDISQNITLSSSGGSGTHTYSIVCNPSHGTVTISDDVATYTPDENYNGEDSFTYKATDSQELVSILVQYL